MIVEVGDRYVMFWEHSKLVDVFLGVFRGIEVAVVLGVFVDKPLATRYHFGENWVVSHTINLRQAISWTSVGVGCEVDDVN